MVRPRILVSLLIRECGIKMSIFVSHWLHAILVLLSVEWLILQDYTICNKVTTIMTGVINDLLEVIFTYV